LKNKYSSEQPSFTAPTVLHPDLRIDILALRILFTMSVFFLILCAITPLVASYLVAPPGTPYPEASEDCSGWVEGTTSLTCAEVEEAYYITAAELQSWVSRLFSFSSG
jgi:hypothetical protein